MGARIVITGANSAVGQAILRLGAQRREPLWLVAAVRSDRAVRDLPPLETTQIARISYDNPSSLIEVFGGASAVIHLAGTLVERPGSSYDAANVQTTRAVVDASAKSHVGKLVLVSAIGADERSKNGYWRSKGLAEAAVRACGRPYTILRAPLLLGPGTEGTAAMWRHLSRPTATLPGGGRNWQQPLHVDDLARAALAAARPGVADGRTLDLVGPVPTREREILERSAQLLGRSLRIRSVPIAVLSTILTVRGLFARGGFSRDVLEVITADTNMDPAPAAIELGIQLTGLDDMLTQGFSQAQQG